MVTENGYRAVCKAGDAPQDAWRVGASIDEVPNKPYDILARVEADLL